MTKRFFTALVLCAITLAASANPITREQAREKAALFLKGKPGRQDLKAVTNLRRLAPAGGPTANYYVFDRGSNDGYVIVSGDDQTISVLGYTDSGDFDYAALPPNMKEWLDDYGRQVDAIQKGAPVKKAAIPTHPKVDPLVSSTWSQGYPYNMYCPLDDGANSVTGCVATAMAQLLYYNREKSVDETQAEMPAFTTWTKGIHADGIAAGSPIDWANMKDNYGSATDLQRQAVAHLMHYCGVSVKMDYTKNSSGAQSWDAYLAFINYFGYGSSTKFVDYTSVSDDAEWDRIVYNEISSMRPIYISGANSGGGHAFVCDGYDGNYLYHINWGWGGTSDGYYLLTDLTPGQQGIGGSGDGYTGYRQIIIGLEPENYGAKTMSFADANVKKICLEQFDANGDGKLTYSEAAEVKDLGSAFTDKTNVRTFDELYYFTSLTSLSADAFNGCVNLTAVRLPKALKAIGARAFKNCSKLTQLKMPTGITSLGEEAFSGCRQLEDLELPTGLKVVETGTFKGCAAFSTIDLPISVTDIKAEAFANCTGLTQFKIITYQPAGITLGEGVFSGSSLGSATLVTVQGTKAYYDTADQWRDFGLIRELRELSGGQFATMETGNTYYIYNIGTGRYLTKGEAYGTQAVVDTDDPMRFKVSRTNSMPADVYYLTSEDTGKSGKYLFRTSTDGNVGSGVKATFVDGTSTTNANWHIVAAGNNIYTIQTPESATGYNADEYLGVQTDHASNAASPTYGAYSDIAYTVQPQNCQWYFVLYDEALVENYRAAKKLEALLETAQKRGVDAYSEQSVYDNTGSSTAELREAQNTLRRKLNYIVFADDAARETCLGKCDLNGDDEISYGEAKQVKDAEMRFDTSITSFDEFQYFTNIPTVYANTFLNCANLQSVVLPESVERIYYFAFKGCRSLTSINLSEYLVNIGASAFQGCSSLREVYIKNPDPGNIQLGSDIFGGVNLAACTLYVPLGAKERYAQADVWKDFGNIVEIRTKSQPLFSPFADGAEGYLFNMATRKYLNRGEAYGTQSVVAKSGLLYKIVHTSSMPDGTFYLDFSDKVVFRTSTDEKVGEGVKACFYDGSISSKAYWHAQNLGDNIYTLQVPANDATYVEDEYLGTESSHQSATNDGITFGIYWDIKGTGAACQWALVTEEAMKAAEKFDALIGDFGRLLEEAKAAGNDVSDEQAVYDNAASTEEDVSKAIRSLRTKLHFIDFADDKVKTICISNWDANGDGEIHEDEAARVTSIGSAFTGQSGIKTFKELRFFTALKTIPDNAFRDCSSLTTVYLPKNIETLGRFIFSLCPKLKYVVIENDRQVIPFDINLNTIPTAAAIYVPETLLADYEADANWSKDRYVYAFTGKPLVTATATRTYGRYSASINVLVYGAPIDGEPVAECATITDRKAAAGTYPITVSPGTVTTPDVEFSDGTFTITPAPMTVTAASYTREIHTPNPQFEITYGRFQNQETSDVFITQPVIACDATIDSPAGVYEIRVSGAEAQNYEFTYVNGTLTIIDSAGVEAVTADGKDLPVYDLQGRRVAEPQRGIYIRGHKKYHVEK